MSARNPLREIPVLERIDRLATLEDLFENLLDCPDESTWLARLRAVAGEG